MGFLLGPLFVKIGPAYLHPHNRRCFLDSSSRVVITVHESGVSDRSVHVCTSRSFRLLSISPAYLPRYRGGAGAYLGFQEGGFQKDVHKACENFFTTLPLQRQGKGTQHRRQECLTKSLQLQSSSVSRAVSNMSTQEEQLQPTIGRLCT